MGNVKKTRKLVALITYIVALVGLLLGLFLPFTGSGEGTAAMLALQLPAALNGIYPLEFLKEFAGNNPFAFSYALAQWGDFTLDMGAILVILYALVTLAGIVALIPAIANAVSGKAKKNIALRAASFIEVLAAAVLASLLFMALNYVLIYGGGIESFTCFTVMGAFGGVLLMLVVQAFFFKKGSGVIKFILALLGVVAALLAYDITAIIPQLADPLNGMCANLDWLGTGLAGNASAVAFINAVLLPGFTLPEDAKLATITLAGAITAYIVLINCVLDIMGLGKKTNRAMLIANVIRYALEIAAIAVVIIVAAITDGTTIGLMSIVIAVLAIIAFVIDIIRLVTFKSRKSAKHEVHEATAEGEAKAETRKERKEREKAEKLAAKEAKRAEKEAAKAQKEAVAEEAPAEEAPVSVYSNDADGNVVYTPVIYNGPTDDFIRTLSNDQKLEFSRVFLERQASALTCIPDYNVGGKNDKFFASVFIYYSKVRDLVSDGLMNEIYKQANLMK